MTKKMQTVVALDARVVQLRAVEQGAHVGDRATWRAVVSVGYADGFLRAASQHDLLLSSRRRHARLRTVTGVQTCALPICSIGVRRSFTPVINIVGVVTLPTYM